MLVGLVVETSTANIFPKVVEQHHQQQFKTYISNNIINGVHLHALNIHDKSKLITLNDFKNDLKIPGHVIAKHDSKFVMICFVNGAY